MTVAAEREPRSGGALLFAQFAYPPNSLGLCGPDDNAALLEVGDALANPSSSGRGSGRSQTANLQAELTGLARGFDGAWPYLELIAAANAINDPLDRRVVEAYWIGSRLLDQVPPALLGDSLDHRFRRRAGPVWDQLVASVEVGARPHHNFHVMCVYPWVGLLKQGRCDQPLRVLDQCRIRWGTVQGVVADEVIVTGSRLAWDGHRLGLGPVEPQTVRWRRAGHAFGREPVPGQIVALHWDWLCVELPPLGLAQLRAQTALQLAIVNDRLDTSGPAAVIER